VILLSEIVATLTANLNSARLFPTMTTVTFRPESDTCPRCEGPMKVWNTTSKTVATLAVGRFVAHEYRYYCPQCGQVVGSQELATLVPQRCRIGYDVLVLVGTQFFLNSRDNEQIVNNLREKNVDVSRSEVSYLAKKFIVYLALLHKQMRSHTRSFPSLGGGYILHLDGTCEGDSPHLISVLDGITDIVLDNTKVASENADELIPFLQEIKAAYGDPVAVVSDMGKGIVAAIGTVFPDVPLFICHFHFLKSVGKELFGKENEAIRNRLKTIGVQGILRKRLRALAGVCEAAESVQTFISGIKTEDPTKPSSHMIVYSLLQWALEGKHQGEGRGFPFDQPHLVFYRRLVRVHTLVGRLRQAGLFDGSKEKRLYTTIRSDLQPVIRDTRMKSTAAVMQEKVEVFSRLRTAMRITLPQNKRGLNDEGEPCRMKTIEEGVMKFMRRLCKDKTRMQDKAYRKLIDHITENRCKLFCDLIVVETQVGKIIIQPHRTNNILEIFFRNFMRTYRKKNGFQAMEKALKTMLKDTPLVMNLRNEDFVDLLLDGKKDLAVRFADIDAVSVREQMKDSSGAEHLVSVELKRLIASSTFPESLTFLIRRKVS
jgi:hypothetical protein